jgi:hypothetical protein
VRAGAEPDRPALERAPLVLAHPAPDAGVLAGLDRPAQAFLHHRAAAADLFRFLDLEQRRTAVPDGEEQLGSTSRQAASWRQSMMSTPSRRPGACGCVRFARLSIACEAFHEPCRLSPSPKFPGATMMPSINAVLAARRPGRAPRRRRRRHPS